MLVYTATKAGFLDDVRANRIDEAIQTGESRPRAVEGGDRVLAGSLNIDGQLWIEAHHVGDDRAISRMQRMLDEARLRQPPIQRVADRIAAVMVELSEAALSES